MSLKRKYSNEAASGENGEIEDKQGPSDAVSTSSPTIFLLFQPSSSRTRFRLAREMKLSPTIPVPENYIAIFNPLLYLPRGLI